LRDLRLNINGFWWTSSTGNYNEFACIKIMDSNGIEGRCNAYESRHVAATRKTSQNSVFHGVWMGIIHFAK